MPQIIDLKDFTSYKAKVSIVGLWIMFIFLFFSLISRIAYGIDRFSNISNNFISFLHETIPLGIINWTFFVLLLINWYFHSRWFNSIHQTKQDLGNFSLITNLHEKRNNTSISFWWFIPILNIFAPTLILLEINNFFSIKFSSTSYKVRYYILVWALLFTLWYLLVITHFIVTPFFPEDYDLQYNIQTFGLELLTDFIQLISIIPMILIIKKMTKFEEDYFNKYNPFNISEHLID